MACTISAVSFAVIVSIITRRNSATFCACGLPLPHLLPGANLPLAARPLGALGGGAVAVGCGSAEGSEERLAEFIAGPPGLARDMRHRPRTPGVAVAGSGTLLPRYSSICVHKSISQGDEEKWR